MKNLSSIDLKDCLIIIGEKRVEIWKMTRGKRLNPFESSLLLSFTSVGKGDKTAERLFEKIMNIASGKGGSIYEYLSDLKRKGTLHSELKSIISFSRLVSITDRFLELEKKYRLRKGPAGFDKKRMTEFYGELKKVKGIGDKKVCHYIIYDLIRVYNFPLPEHLEIYDELRRNLIKFGLDPHQIENKEPEKIPYLDAAIFDLSV